MKDKGHKKKKATIFQMFLIPLIVIMLVQSVITIRSEEHTSELQSPS